MRRGVLGMVCLVVACGGKTGLEVEPCGADGGLRPCTNVCGDGVQRCVAGRWTECAVEAARLACSNACGEGTRSCVEGALGECEVAPTRLVCTDACGSGTQSCVDGVLGECEDVPDAERPCSTECGDGIQRCTAGAWGRCSADVPLPPVLDVRVRDFRRSHPDFEAFAFGRDPDIVLDRLGRDDKPIYAGGSPTTSDREAFDQWYRDVAGINLGAALELPLTAIDEEASLFVYDAPEFFPIDGELFGNEDFDHNFHFTLEATTEFLYQGGEIFRFRGDDDMWVFINRRLAIDLGGVHSRLEASVALDEAAEELGIELGRRYPLHLFFAERHSDESSFTVETSIAATPRCEP